MRPGQCELRCPLENPDDGDNTSAVFNLRNHNPGSDAILPSVSAQTASHLEEGDFQKHTKPQELRPNRFGVTIPRETTHIVYETTYKKLDYTVRDIVIIVS